MVLIIGISYAFITATIEGARKQVINAGVLELILEEDKELSISNAFPMADEVGMIQEPFTFRLINNSNVSVKYKLKMVKVQADNELELSDVKYGFTKEDDTTIDLLSNLTSEVIDEGIIEGTSIINYSLRLWIRDGVTDEDAIAGKSLSYKIDVDVSQLEGSEFVVSFDSQGGESISDMIYTYGFSYRELPTPIRNGYTFNGWYTSEDELITETTIVTTLPNNTLYAKWNIDTYSVTIDPNGGTWEGTTVNQKLNLEYQSTSDIVDPTRVGYTFTGWDLTGAASKIDDGVFTMGNENATLTATWIANEYTVSFNTNGGSGSTASISVTYDGTYGNLPTPATRTGYTFAGWYTQASGGTQVTASSLVKITTNQTLYAHWTANKYTVTLTKGTGIASVSGAGTYTYGQSVTVKATLSSGYTWVNWSGTYSSTSQTYTFTMPARNVTLTANGKQSITYLLGNGSDGSSIHGGFVGQPYTGFGYKQNDPDWLEAPTYTVSASSIQLTGWGSRYGSISTAKQISLTKYSKATFVITSCADVRIGFSQTIEHLFTGPYIGPSGAGTYTIDLSGYSGNWYLIATYKGKGTCTITQISLT